jgi:transposase-like protein
LNRFCKETITKPDHVFSESDIENCIKSINLNSISECPFCKGENISKNGKTKIKRQRYICKDCGKGFSEMTASPFMYSKKPIKTWVKYIYCIKKNLTLREISNSLGINLTTSFYWRHKILSVLGTKINDKKLLNIIEINELKITENFKGNREIKHDTLNRKRNYIMILSCKDTEENELFKASAKNRIGRLDRADLDKILAPSIKNGKVIATPRNDKYVNFAKANKLRLCMVGSYSYVIPGITAKRAEEQSRKFKKFLHGFSGVASKYINYYINWFRLKIENNKDAELDLLNKFASGKRQLRVYEFNKVQYDGSLSNS